MEKKELLEDFIREAKSEIEMYERHLEGIDEKYIGKTLENQTRQYNKWLNESKTKVEAYELLLKSQ